MTINTITGNFMNTFYTPTTASTYSNTFATNFTATTGSNFYTNVPTTWTGYNTTCSYQNWTITYTIDDISPIPNQDIIEFDEEIDDVLEQLEREIEAEASQKSVETNYNRAMEILK